MSGTRGMTESKHHLVGGRAVINDAAGWWTTLLMLGLAGATACATPAKTGPSAAETERAMVALRAKNAGYQQRIEELENRIFVLEDQLDSRRVASQQRAPTVLPARIIRADGTATVAVASSAPPEV